MLLNSLIFPSKIFRRTPLFLLFLQEIISERLFLRRGNPRLLMLLRMREQRDTNPALLK